MQHKCKTLSVVAILTQILPDRSRVCLDVYTIQCNVVLKIHSWTSVCLTYKEKYIFVFYVIKAFLISFQISISGIFFSKRKKSSVFYISICWWPVCNQSLMVHKKRVMVQVSLRLTLSLCKLLYLPASFKMIVKCLLAVSWACMPTYDVIQLFAGWGKKTCK